MGCECGIVGELLTTEGGNTIDVSTGLLVGQQKELRSSRESGGLFCFKNV